MARSDQRRYRCVDHTRGWRAAARAVNTAMTRTYWLVGQHIVDHEQRGSARANYGEELIARLAADLTGRFGRGFSARNLAPMRAST